MAPSPPFADLRAAWAKGGCQVRHNSFTKTVRLKKYARKRIVMVHECAGLSDSPRFLLTDAKHRESGRIMKT
ncbi:MAG: hypothetical protein AB7G75_21675 [Candidatus Binatia bacterium]